MDIQIHTVMHMPMALEDMLTAVIMAMARIMVILLQHQEQQLTMVPPPIKSKLLQVIE
mgnify:CR=1 FL=1